MTLLSKEDVTTPGMSTATVFLLHMYLYAYLDIYIVPVGACRLASIPCVTRLFLESRCRGCGKQPRTTSIANPSCLSRCIGVHLTTSPTHARAYSHPDIRAQDLVASKPSAWHKEPHIHDDLKLKEALIIAPSLGVACHLISEQCTASACFSHALLAVPQVFKVP